MSILGLISGTPTNDTRVGGLATAGIGDPDGRGDEPYAAAYVRRFNRSTFEVIESSVSKTWPYGDITGFAAGRLQGGSQTPTGGVRAGDSVPTGFSVPRAYPPTAAAFPLRLWQGTLSDGGDIVLVTPTIWEHDGDTSVFQQWAQSQSVLDNTILQDAAVQSRLTTQLLSPVAVGTTSNVVGLLGTLETLLTGTKDRPIGLVAAADRTVRLPNTTLVLTREILERALSSPSPAQATTSPGVVITSSKPGVLVLNYADSAAAGGQALYSLVLQVERL